MRRFRSNSAPQRDPQDALGLALRQEFSRDVAVQRDQVPTVQSILLVAQFEARIRHRSRADALATWTGPLLFCTVAGLFAFWWSRLAATPLNLADLTEPWMEATGLAALLFGMAFGWTRRLLRTG